MKKLLAIVLALMLCVSALSVMAFAAQTTTVHAYVPSDWAKPNVYGWTDPDGNPNWPGTAMTQEDGQWYTGTIDIVNNRVIINNDTGSPQTVDLEMDAGFEEIWVVVGTADAEGKFSGTVYYEKPENVDAPADPGPGTDAPAEDVNPADPSDQFAPPSSLAIVGTGIPGVGEWDPANAAGDMYVVSENVYEIEIGCPAGTNMTFKFAGNDAWDDTCNLGSGTPAIGSTVDLVNGNTAGDMTLSVDKDVKLKFTVDLTALVNDTGAATLKIEEVEGEVEPAPAPVEVTVYARVSTGWGAPNLYTWSTGLEGSVAWPGTAMTKDEGDWYVGKMPAGETNLIINDGTSQTSDLTVEAGKETVWVDVVDGVGTVYYEKPADRVPEETQPLETQPAETEPSETQPEESEPEETQPTAPAAPDKSANKTTSILVIVLVLVWIVFLAEVISVFFVKKS